MRERKQRRLRLMSSSDRFNRDIRIRKHRLLLKVRQGPKLQNQHLPHQTESLKTIVIWPKCPCPKVLKPTAVRKSSRWTMQVHPMQDQPLKAWHQLVGSDPPQPLGLKTTIRQAHLIVNRIKELQQPAVVNLLQLQTRIRMNRRRRKITGRPHGHSLQKKRSSSSTSQRSVCL